MKIGQQTSSATIVLHSHIPQKRPSHAHRRHFPRRRYSANRQKLFFLRTCTVLAALLCWRFYREKGNIALCLAWSARCIIQSTWLSFSLPGSDQSDSRFKSRECQIRLYEFKTHPSRTVRCGYDRHRHRESLCTLKNTFSNEPCAS